MKTDEGYEMPTQTVFEQQMEALQADMREVRGAITDMAKAVSKLAVLEERNLATNHTIEKVVTRLEKLDEKVARIELKQVEFIAKTDGISKTMKWMWGAFGGGVIYLGSELIKLIASA